MPRPELPPLSKGQTVLMTGGGGRRDEAPREMQVVTLGPKWVGLVDPRWAGTEAEKSFTRKFLLSDQGEGERGSRYGYSARFATREQHDWDVLVDAAAAYVRNVAGLDVRRGAVPFSGEDGILKLAHILNLMESSWRPSASP